MNLGADLEAAKRGVALFLAKRAVDPVQRVLAKLETPAVPLGDHLDWFAGEIVAKKRSPKTRYERTRQLGHVRAAFGVRDVGSIDRAAVAKFLERFPTRASINIAICSTRSLPMPWRAGCAPTIRCWAR